jgi:hypothetical protein
MDDKIVGHKTFRTDDGGFRHEPLTESEAASLWAECEAEQAKRAADMPTEQDAIKAMFSAWLRLKELGWKEAIYCPKDGSTFKAIEPGSTGIFDCSYEGEWPKGSWWCYANNDVYPSRPTLFKPNGDTK